MEPTNTINNIRARVVISLMGVDSSADKKKIWTAGAEDFLRKIIKSGHNVVVIGPKPIRKIGTKKNIVYFDRHEIVGLKTLEASLSHHLELRVLNRKNKSWTRIRTDACVAYGPLGVWPKVFKGWSSPGMLSINAALRWITEYKVLPGNRVTFIGSSNQVFRCGTRFLDLGAKQVHIVERGKTLQCWKAYRDQFVAKGGRILLNHQVSRVASNEYRVNEIYLKNEQGTLILNTDTIVLAPANEEVINPANQSKEGLFYVQNRMGFGEDTVDEEFWLERLDWTELYWRLARVLKFSTYAQVEGGLKKVKKLRRDYLSYRKTPSENEFKYSGKILNRESLEYVQSSKSTPKHLDHAKPVASLECFENIPCRACVDICPDDAIQMTKITDLPKLIEDKCTGCGACVAVCPAGAAVMLKEEPTQQKVRYFLPDDTEELWKPNQSIELLNRKGDLLDVGKVVNVQAYQSGIHRVLEVLSSNVHVWEARKFNQIKRNVMSDENFDHLKWMGKKGWVHFNGVRRSVPVDVPATVSLWLLGVHRFEDALFCRDGSCRLCEIKVNGKSALACQTTVQQGVSIECSSQKQLGDELVCPCNGITAKEYLGLIQEGVPEKLAKEVSNLGLGTCHGKWCLRSSELSFHDEKLRPGFPGYEISPWRDIWAGEVCESPSSDD